MYPEEGTWSRFLPFRKRGAVNEPCPGFAVLRFAGDVVIFPWIRRREPSSNIDPQHVTCQIVSAVPHNNANIL
jgi:hypothetical protein